MYLREDPRWPYAQEYINRGWPIFVLGKNKTPLPNCPDCARADWTHDREACQCLTCHGFYAATTSQIRVIEMLKNHDGLLAVRCGSPSGLLVFDFEASAEPGEPTGLEVMDQWKTWAGVDWDLPPTLRALTASAGMHLFYRYPTGVRIPMRNRILPSTDLKAEYGYVAVPCGLDTRQWANGDSLSSLRAEPAELPVEAVSWLRTIRGRRTGRSSDVQTERPSGYDYARCIVDGPQHGERDEFWNDYLFRMRKNGVARGLVWESAQQLWVKWNLGEGSDAFPFEWVEYKIDRVWSTVAPDDVNDARQAWARRQDELQSAGEANVPTLDEHRQRYVTWGHVKTIPGTVL